MRKNVVPTSLVCVLLTGLVSAAAQTPSIKIGTFKEEARRESMAADGLPANAIISVVVLDVMTPLGGTTSGLARSNSHYDTRQGRRVRAPGLVRLRR